jgi:hypothetical protein
VMNWNVQNLLPVGHPDGPPSAAAYAAKLAGLAEVIDAVGPDVLAVQEVGPAEVLADLDAACRTPFAHRITGVEDDRGIRVGLLSTRPLTAERDVTAFPAGILPVQWRDTVFDPPTTTTTSRGILAADLDVDGEIVTLLTCHLKSKLITYARDGIVPGNQFAPNDEGERLRYAGYALNRRAAEAMTCRAALDEILTADGDPPGDGDGTGRVRGVVCCGDMNDAPDAATTQIMQGPGGSEIDLDPGSGFRTGDRGDGWRMWNLWPLLPAEGPQHTRVYRGRGELIDHIFASHRLVNPANLPTVEIVAAATLPSMGDVPPAQSPPNSDHAAVVATFTI